MLFENVKEKKKKNPKKIEQISKDKRGGRGWLKTLPLKGVFGSKS